MEKLLLTGQAPGCRRGFAKVFVNPVFPLVFFCSISLVLHLVSHQARDDSGIDFSSTKSAQPILLYRVVTGNTPVGATARCCTGITDTGWSSILSNPLKKEFQDDLEKKHYVSPTSLKK